MMSSSPLQLGKRRKAYVRLIGEIQHALNQALTEENESRGLTKAKIADLLGKNKSFVSRKLAGSSNMTLETLSDLAYALNRPVKISIPARSPQSGSNEFYAATPSTTPSSRPKAEPVLTVVTATA